MKLLILYLILPPGFAPPALSRDAVIRVYDEAGNVIARREHTGDFKDW